MISTISKDDKQDDPYYYLNLLETEIVSNKLLKTEIIVLKTEIVELKCENDKLKSELAKYQSPHIPSSKKIFDEKKESLSKITRTYKGNKRGGSKKGSESWIQQLPPKIIKSYVNECISCLKTADQDKQEFNHSKSIIDIPEKIKLIHLKSNNFVGPIS